MTTHNPFKYFRMSLEIIHLAAEFPEVFDIEKLIVLGEISPEIAQTYAAFGAEIRTKVAGFS
tara:strand:- start:359 stop:544 length:186 start_codon:yes stop_codon:yes gene_type:complete